MILMLAIIYGILGLVIGSFLNVVIFRVPKGESIVTPRSHCPECGHILRPWELIPLMSYLFLAGRCSNCKTPISMRYTLIEIATGILFVLTYWARPERTAVGLLFDFGFISLLIALSLIDLDTFRLPDVLVLLVATLAVTNTLVTGEPVLWRSLGGALSVGTVFLLIAYIYPQGMGWGDVKFVAALGLYLGLPDILAGVFVGSLLGVIVGVAQIYWLKKNYKDPIPFGPFLAVGALIILLFKQNLITICPFFTPY